MRDLASAPGDAAEGGAISFHDKKLRRHAERDAVSARLRSGRRPPLLCDVHLPSLAMPWVSRETLRFAALRWITPFWAARMISGAADFNASAAAVLSPEAIASSTLRTEVRISERRDLF